MRQLRWLVALVAGGNRRRFTVVGTDDRRRHLVDTVDEQILEHVTALRVGSALRPAVDRGDRHAERGEPAGVLVVDVALVEPDLGRAAGVRDHELAVGLTRGVVAEHERAAEPRDVVRRRSIDGVEDRLLVGRAAGVLSRPDDHVGTGLNGHDVLEVVDPGREVHRSAERDRIDVRAGKEHGARGIAGRHLEAGGGAHVERVHRQVRGPDPARLGHRAGGVHGRVGQEPLVRIGGLRREHVPQRVAVAVEDRVAVGLGLDDRLEAVRDRLTDPGGNQSEVEILVGLGHREIDEAAGRGDADPVDARARQVDVVIAPFVELGRIGERRAEPGLDRLLALGLGAQHRVVAVDRHREVEQRQHDQRTDDDQRQHEDQRAALVPTLVGVAAPPAHRVTLWMHETASLAATLTLMPFHSVPGGASGMSTSSKLRIAPPARQVHPAGV